MFASHRVRTPSKWFVTSGTVCGSGPAPGVLDRLVGSDRIGASDKYCPPTTWLGAPLNDGVEFVFDFRRRVLAYGMLKRDHGLSPHENLVLALRLPRNTEDVVAGHLRWDRATRRLETNEHTGHYLHLWTPDARARFRSEIQALGISDHKHQWGQ